MCNRRRMCVIHGNDENRNRKNWPQTNATINSRIYMTSLNEYNYVCKKNQKRNQRGKNIYIYREREDRNWGYSTCFSLIYLSAQ